VEVDADSISLLSSASPKLPFYPNTPGVASTYEETRLRHRVLDLRNAPLQLTIKFRAYMARLARNFLDSIGFHEIETPTLFRRTPGGALEFLVPTQDKGRCYALVQSPQQYKQMLMIGGLDRYYQFARCYRDEGGRMDRQPEFTQLDLEMSFASQAEIMAAVESVAHVWFRGPNDQRLPAFPVMTYQTAMENYGSDKPDLRYDMKINDVTAAVVVNEHVPLLFASRWKDGDGIFALRLEHAAEVYNRSQIDALRAEASSVGLEHLILLKYGSSFNISEDKLSLAHQHALAHRLELKPGDAIALAASQPTQMRTLLGKLRPRIAKKLSEAKVLKLSDADYAFTWIIDFPLFEQDENGEVVFVFSLPILPPQDD